MSVLPGCCMQKKIKLAQVLSEKLPSTISIIWTGTYIKAYSSIIMMLCKQMFPKENCANINIIYNEIKTLLTEVTYCVVWKRKEKALSRLDWKSWVAILAKKGFVSGVKTVYFTEKMTMPLLFITIVVSGIIMAKK